MVAPTRSVTVAVRTARSTAGGARRSLDLMDRMVAQLAEVKVFDPAGANVRLGRFWEGRPVLLAMIRHFGWIFCKAQAAQLRDYVPRIHAAGGELVVLGNGTPQQAAWFVEDFKMETPVVTDPELASHRIVGARKPLMMDPRPLLRAAGAARAGFRQTQTMGSAMQLGGVFVITAAGEMPYRYLSRYAGDHPPPEDAVRALEEAATAVRSG